MKGLIHPGSRSHRPSACTQLSRPRASPSRGHSSHSQPGGSSHCPTFQQGSSRAFSRLLKICSFLNTSIISELSAAGLNKGKAMDTQEPARLTAQLRAGRSGGHACDGGTPFRAAASCQGQGARARTQLDPAGFTTIPGGAHITKTTASSPSAPLCYAIPTQLKAHTHTHTPLNSFGSPALSAGLVPRSGTGFSPLT